MSVGATAAVVAAAAAAAEELLRHEEEEMTGYSEKDLAEGWEFKIVRASTAAFRKPEQLRAVLEEEKMGGWVLVEKFDDSRIRLKRPAGSKMMEQDFADGYDPYRTTVGVSGEKSMVMILGVTGLILFIFMMVIIFATGH